MEGNLLEKLLRPKLIAVAALALASVVSAPSAFAQQPAAQPQAAATETYGSWGLICSKPKACQIQVVLANKDTKKFVAALVYTEKGPNKVMMGVVPLGFLLEAKPSLKVDTGSSITGTYVQCISSGCRISLPASDAILQDMRGGKQAILTVMAPGNKPVSLNFDLTGFADAKTALDKKVQ